MRRFPKLKFAFLLYLVLFLNLGDSVHHSPFFGLHSHDSEGRNGYSFCSCGCHQHSTEHSHADHQDPTNHLADSDFGSSLACPFCKFFDEYNVTLDVFEFTLSDSPFYSWPFVDRSVEQNNIILTCARAPPREPLFPSARQT